MNKLNLQEDIQRTQQMMGLIIESDSNEGEFTEKWSEKYKKSINCNNPKGFSQKAHCTGKHTEMKEDELDSKIGEEAETTEYARTLANTRKQGVGLKFSKLAIKNNPQRFRYYTRQNTNEVKNDVNKGNIEWKETNGKLSREYKFSSYKDTIDFVNKVSEIAEEQKHHPKMVVGFNTVKVIMFDHEKGEISDKCYKFTNAVDDMMSETKNKGEQNESELTEKCWVGYTQKGMKTMFGKEYPNCVKKKK